jgi:hypothetical protein
MKLKTLFYIIFLIQFTQVNSQVYNYGNVTVGELSDSNSNGASAKILYKKI